METTATITKKIAPDKPTEESKKVEKPIFNIIPDLNDEFLSNNSLLFMKLTAVELKSTEKFAKFVNEVVNTFNDLSAGMKEAADTATNLIVTGAVKVVEGVDNAAEVVAKIATAEDSKAAMIGYLESFAEKVADNNEQAEEGSLSGEDLAYWWLPLPTELKSKMSHNYKTDTVNPLDKIIGLKSKAMLNMGVDVINKVPGGVGAATRTLMNSIKPTLEKGQIIAKRHNSSLDTNIINIYDGTPTRNFSFSFNIIPLNQSHANQILDALLNLKKYMTGIREKEIVKQTCVFKVSFIEISSSAGFHTSDYIEALLNISEIELNLTDIGLTLGSDGAMMLYADGMPKSIMLTMNLEERKPLYRIEETAEEKQ